MARFKFILAASFMVLLSAALALPNPKTLPDAISDNRKSLKSACCAADSIQSDRKDAVLYGEGEGLTHLAREEGKVESEAPHQPRPYDQFNYDHGLLLAQVPKDHDQLYANYSTNQLQPESEVGPYYVDGEFLRRDIRGQQIGVFFVLNLQLMDVSTNKPIPDVYVEVWHCNATGSYSGVSAIANGDSGLPGDENLNRTFHRGIEKTSVNGTIQFISIFPGHEYGRTTHIHVIIHTLQTTLNSNGTVLAGTRQSTHVSHVAQIYFDQHLIDSIDTIWPYTVNPHPRTRNADDVYLQHDATTVDPFVTWAAQGNVMEKGIFAWIGLGIDPGTDSEIRSMATLYDTGGVSHKG